MFKGSQVVRTSEHVPSTDFSTDIKSELKPALLEFGHGRPYVTDEELIDQVHELGLDVVGMSFQIAPGCATSRLCSTPFVGSLE